MDNQALHLALALLAAAVALNLKLTIAVLKTGRRERNAPAPLLPGEPAPRIAGRSLQRWGQTQMLFDGQPAALLFLSSKCPKCVSKLAELERMLPGARQAGLAMWLVSAEPAWRLRRFLGAGFPLSQVLRVSPHDYKLLNARVLSPAYLFVNHDGVVEASGLIGDENWLGLRAQLALEGAAT